MRNNPELQATRNIALAIERTGSYNILCRKQSREGAREPFAVDKNYCRQFWREI